MPFKIGTKLVIAVVFFAIMGIGITAGFAFDFYRTAIIEEMIQAGRQLSGAVKGALREDMMHNRTEGMRQIISSVGNQAEVTRVRMFNKAGIIRYSSDAEEENTKVDKRAEACLLCHANDASQPPKATLQHRLFNGDDNVLYLGISDPVYNDRSCWTAPCHAHKSNESVLGFLEVDIPLTQMEKKIQTGRLHTVLFALAAVIAISFITLILVRQLILVPVAKVVDATNRVGGGEWTNPIYGARQDEMGQLIHAFNRMQEKMQVSQRQLIMSGKLASVGKLAAGVAHEINNPLTGILTFAEDLIDESDTDDPRMEDYQVIRRETMRCREIVRNLLDFARPEKPAITSVDIRDVIMKSVKLVERLAQFQNCRINADLQLDLPLVRGDEGQLQQVFLNLIVNASEAMPDGGEIRIASRHEPGDPLIEVIISDEGLGMTSDQKQHIFEPFFSTKGGRTQGLGLSVSWGIIEQHGGSIDVVTAPDAGTTFTVRLPVDRSGMRWKS